VQQVSRRIKWHNEAPDVVRKAVCDNLLEEGHVQAVFVTSQVPKDLHLWLTTDGVRTSLAQEVLGKHTGSSAGIKPTVRKYRQAWARAIRKGWPGLHTDALTRPWRAADPYPLVGPPRAAIVRPWPALVRQRRFWRHVRHRRRP